MRYIVKIIALALLPPLVLGGHAQTIDNEPKVITLSCDGTVTDTSSTPVPVDQQPKSIEKMGVVANLNKRTVSFQGFVAPISSVDAASININGELIGPVAQIGSKEGYTTKINGILDRVTGHMTADTMTYETKELSNPNSVVIKDHYDVLCKATNRVF